MQLYARALKASGAIVSVIAIHYPHTSEKYTWHGIPVYPLKGNNRKFQTLLLKRKAVHIFKTIHKALPVDVVHSFWLNQTTIIGKAIAKSKHVPLIATAMGQEMRTSKSNLIRFKKADFPIVALCDFQKEALEKRGIQAQQLIPWGIEEAISREKRVDLICVGNLVPLKNSGYFVELCAELLKSKPDLRAKIVGIGPLASQLQNQIKEHGLQDHVELTGSLDYHETQQLIAQSKVLVSASDFEGFGMTIIEAMAHKTHVIASPVGIAKELEIPHLTFDVALDAAMIQVQLRSGVPEAVIWDIKDTVVAYRAIYEYESKEKENAS